MRRKRHKTGHTPATETQLRELVAIYQDADAAYDGHACPGSTECCRFHITGREPYVTTIEVAYVNVAIAAHGGPLGRNKRALPLIDDEGTCPLLDRAGKCSVYEHRPLGCRTFWCSRATHLGPVKQSELNQLVRRVRELAERHAPAAVQGRPLRKALG